MNTRTFLSPLFTVLLAGLGLILAAPASAQTFTVLHSFNEAGTPNYGYNSYASLLLSGNTLYGTTQYGGSATGWGTVFAVNTDGSGFSVLHNFYGSSFSDGAWPWGGMVLSSNTLYGTASYGGVNNGGNGYGTVFAVKTDGSSGPNTTLDFFNIANGFSPENCSLILSGNTLYGTAEAGGLYGGGVLFKASTDGVFFTNFYNFTAYTPTNSDGIEPLSGLIISGNTLYGMATGGGTNHTGTIFSVNTSGANFTNLHTFAAAPNGYNSDGAFPEGGLVLSGNTLYGTTYSGGANDYGTVFRVNTDGTGFTNLHSFARSDGASPTAALVLSGKTLYGTALGIDDNNRGTVFTLNTDGTGFTNLYNFPSAADGSSPNGLILSGYTLYGTTQSGGTNGGGSGTVFSLTVPITLFHQHIGGAVVLSWNDPSFVLQAAPAVTGTYTNIPGATSPYTNTFAGLQQFFRLLVSQ